MGNGPIGVIASFQGACAQRVAADPYFSNVPVITENIGDIENIIDRAIGQIGVCVILITPTAEQTKPTCPLFFDHINIIARVIENVTTNRGDGGTGKAALDIAEVVAALLHQFRPFNDSGIVTVDRNTLTLVPDRNKLVVYDIRFKTNGGLKYIIPEIELVSAASVGGNVELTVARPGAAIFYTTGVDEAHTDFPSPRKSDGTQGNLYLAPISSLASGTYVKAMAWLAGYESTKVVGFVVP